MAIFSWHADIIRRSEGQSVIATAARYSGTQLYDERQAKTINHSDKTGRIYSDILTPERAPVWMKDREKLWNAIEAGEKRKDAQLARDIQIALPKELNTEQQIELFKAYINTQFVSVGMAADITLVITQTHNPYGYALLTLRPVTEKGFGLKVRLWNDRKQLHQWREAWAEIANCFLALYGHETRIDHRTLAEQGIDRLPIRTIGKAAYHAASRGEKLDRYLEHEKTTQVNLNNLSKTNNTTTTLRKESK
jgi:ATP-dependent exoDNAse (exonuclease V) alpha subunit